tara:strand:- start:215 stop:685 length:471 start_codon:yes stop_codon:yes gene_type:complete
MWTPEEERRYNIFAYKVAGFLNEKDIDRNMIRFYRGGEGSDNITEAFIPIYGHMEEAHLAITGKWAHMADITIKELILEQKHTTMYARLVALCARMSSLLSDERYSMNRTYLRLNFERRRVLNYWRYEHIPRRQSGIKMLRNAAIAAGLNAEFVLH